MEVAFPLARHDCSSSTGYSHELSREEARLLNEHRTSTTSPEGEFTRSAAHAMMLPPPEMDDLALIPGLQMDELAHIERRQRAGRDGAG